MTWEQRARYECERMLKEHLIQLSDLSPEEMAETRTILETFDRNADPLFAGSSAAAAVLNGRLEKRAA